MSFAELRELFLELYELTLCPRCRQKARWLHCVVTMVQPHLEQVWVNECVRCKVTW